MATNPVITPSLRLEMARVTSDGVYSFLTDFVSSMYPNHADPAVADCTIDGLADAIRRYQQLVGYPLVDGLIANLLDQKE